MIILRDFIACISNELILEDVINESEILRISLYSLMGLRINKTLFDHNVQYKQIHVQIYWTTIMYREQSYLYTTREATLRLFWYCSDEFK